MNIAAIKTVFLGAIRALVTLSFCVLLFVSYALPANAISSDKSRPVEGEAPLNDIYQKSEDILKGPPAGMDKVQQETRKGPNEVQGDADLDKMHNPMNSRHATSAAEQAVDALEKATLKR